MAGKRSEPIDVLTASAGTSTTRLGVKVAAGRTFGAGDDNIGGGLGGPVAVISDGCWRRRFGRDPSAIGAGSCT